MNAKDRADIVKLVSIAEGRNAVDFTYHIMSRMRRYHAYTEVFSPTGEDFVLSDDVDFCLGSFVTEDAYRKARQSWRRTALCFAAAMIKTGDL